MTSSLGILLLKCCQKSTLPSMQGSSWRFSFQVRHPRQSYTPYFNMPTPNN
jgi:hypothetical protein